MTSAVQCRTGFRRIKFWVVLQLLRAEFPEGIPCRSRHLPVEISNLPAVRNRTNTIMITTYKKQVKNEIFELRSPAGFILETANNSAGIYSLSQPLPPQPPPPGRSIMFVGRGQRVLLKCPGTTLRDVPVTWRTAEQVMDNAVLAASSGGRVYVDARDRLVIRHVLYEDANLYVCWEGDNIAGTAQLLVWGGPARWNHHTLLLAMAVVGGVLWHISVRLL